MKKKTTLYKIYANKLKQNIRLAKKLYFDKQLQSHQHDFRKTWEVLQELLPKKSINSIPHEIYDSNGILTSNQEEIILTNLIGTLQQLEKTLKRHFLQSFSQLSFVSTKPSSFINVSCANNSPRN